MCSAKVNGGPTEGESLLFGLASGMVLQVFVNNAFPVEVVKAGEAVVCCDMSLHRKKVSTSLFASQGVGRIYVGGGEGGNCRTGTAEVLGFPNMILKTSPLRVPSRLCDSETWFRCQRLHLQCAMLVGSHPYLAGCFIFRFCVTAYVFNIP